MVRFCWSAPRRRWTRKAPIASRDAELKQLEARLADADGRRVWAQQRARADLASRELPINRLTVARRACELLDKAVYAP